MKLVITLGTVTSCLGLILIAAGYLSSLSHISSIIFLLFGVFFVLVGGLYVGILPRIRAPMPQQNNPSPTRPAFPGPLATPKQEASQRNAEQANGNTVANRRQPGTRPTTLK